MKGDNIKPAALLQAAVFPKTIHQKRPDVRPAGGGKAARRENIFSRSRDTHEDRGTRAMKNSHNAQSFPHPH